MKRMALMLGAVAVLGGCGGDVCARLQNMGETLDQKTAACSTETFQSDTTEAQCRASLSKCTSDDQSKLNKWLDCIEALPPCRAGENKEDFDKKVLACLTTHASSVSQACIEGITRSGG